MPMILVPIDGSNNASRVIDYLVRSVATKVVHLSAAPVTLVQ